MHIKYDTKKSGTHARVLVSVRRGDKVEKEKKHNLGLVLDKERGIFQNKRRGVFTYDIATDTFSPPPNDFPLPTRTVRRNESIVITFGETYLLDSFIKSKGLDVPISAIDYNNKDTIRAMVAYYILRSAPNSHALDWYEGSYARILYPEANLVSQRLSECIHAIGKDTVQRSFFESYFTYIKSKGINTHNILIDSTGLPNSVHLHLTAVSNHGGEISNEVRLMYVVDQKTGIPIYYRCFPGNVLDVTTLIRCIEEINALGLTVDCVIIDAGYYSTENIDELYRRKIPFVTRLKENLVVFKNIEKEYAATLEEKVNMVEYNGRYLFIKRVPCTLGTNNGGYAYLGLDLDKNASETKSVLSKAKTDKMTIDDVYEKLNKKSLFAIVSSQEIPTSEILPLYYTRQQIEQVFDVGKTDGKLLPISVESEQSLNGHLLFAFLANVVLRELQSFLRNTKLNAKSVFDRLVNHKCQVFDDVIVTLEPFKRANDCYKAFGLIPPINIARTKMGS